MPKLTGPFHITQPVRWNGVSAHEFGGKVRNIVRLIASLLNNEKDRDVPSLEIAQ